MATLYQSRPEDIFDDSSVSPAQALFPPHLYANGPMPPHRNSLSGQSNGGGIDDDDYAAFQSSLLSGSISNHSRLPSLSPSAHSASYLSANAYQAHSPHSSASPKSNFSGSAYNITDDMLFNTSFGQDDLDMLFAQDGGMMSMGMGNGGVDLGKQKATQMQSGLHLPQDWAFQFPQQNQQQYQPSQLFNSKTNFAPQSSFNTDIFDFSSLTSPKSEPVPTFTQSGYARSNGGSTSTGLTEDQSKAVDKQELEELRRQQRLQAEQIQALQTMHQHQQQQQTYQMPNQGQLQTIPPSWMNMAPAHVQGGSQGHLMAGQGSEQSWTGSVPAAATAASINPSTKRALSPPPRKGRPPKSAKPAASSGDSASPPEHPGGKHNKTERRYRQKVQVAQAELRDAVPALRVHYGTSTEEQKATTDIRATDGTVDGLGEVSRPNASAKATILIGSRMYIELLQNRTAEMQRMIDELMQYRIAVGGQADCDHWKADFDARAAIRREELAKVKREIVEVDESDSEEEEEVPKKRKRGPVPGAKKKKAEAEGGNGVRVFAAFAMSFSLVPSASTLLRHQPVGDISPGHVLSGEATPTQVISRLPLITAEHIYRVFTKILPAVIVPTPGTMVDWTWRLLVAAVLVLVLGPMIRAWTKVDDDDAPAGAGDILEMSKEAVKLGLRIKGVEDEEWVEYAARVLGRVSQSNRLTRYHLALKLRRTANTPYALALLALTQPDIPSIISPSSTWQQARQALTGDDPAPLQAVLALPYDEARHALSLLPITSSPISSIADQITLVHLNDLYSRLFVHLVESTVSHTNLPISVKALLENLNSKNLKADLSSFDQDIRETLRGVSRGTAAHALGLVLIGLWGVFTGPAPAAQATLASALAGEEMSGVGLQSVPAMLDLLFPGSSTASPADRLRLNALPQNAMALDKLALVCIGYIRLLYTCGKAYPGVSKREKAIAVSRATAELRMFIAETNFVGLDSISLISMEAGIEDESLEEDGTDGQDVSEGEGKMDKEGKKFEKAKERLVGVLSVIGRRAAGRGRMDDDSGLDGEIDEL